MLRQSLTRFNAAASRAGKPPVDLRVVREERINAARERIFGTKGTLPGDRYFKMPLEGNEYMTWYFPSKYQFPDFRVEEYFEMQAERLAPREKHESMDSMGHVLQTAMDHRETLRRFFQQVTPEQFRNNPTLQDLYGVYRQVDADDAADEAGNKMGLQFQPHSSLFREHRPMFESDMKSPSEQEEVGDAQAGPPLQVGVPQVYNRYLAILRALKRKAKSDTQFQRLRAVLEARLLRRRSLGEVMSLLESFREQKQLAPPFEVATLMPENGHLVPYSLSPRTKEQPDDLGAFEPYLKRRHRFVDPLFRRRRLKWL
mmetsp:Transcript_35760/g.82056  ORF Transcript_35760/g.82056 Transcript_35760/m.82056 type:complete len:314 (-) Transcript_35760:23-964(-)